MCLCVVTGSKVGQHVQRLRNYEQCKDRRCWKTCVEAQIPGWHDTRLR